MAIEQIRVACGKETEMSWHGPEFGSGWDIALLVVLFAIGSLIAKAIFGA